MENRYVQKYLTNTRRRAPANLYTEITDKIIAELAAGRIPCAHFVAWGTAIRGAARHAA